MKRSKNLQIGRLIKRAIKAFGEIKWSTKIYKWSTYEKVDKNLAGNERIDRAKKS